MTKLSVNLNKIALLRNSREGNYPDLLYFARTCLEAGAHGITVHPRPDQRHIRANDCKPLKETCDHYAVEFNIEGNPFSKPCPSQHPDASDYPGFMELVLDILPDQCTLVPDNNEQLTSDHGFDLRDTETVDKLSPIIDKLKQHKIRVSLFMDADKNQMPLAAEIGADRVEFYTGPYASHFSTNPAPWLGKLVAAADAAKNAGLGINAGHDLNLENLKKLKNNMPNLLEVSIGHALTVDGLLIGYDKAVKAYLNELGQA